MVSALRFPDIAQRVKDHLGEDLWRSGEVAGKTVVLIGASDSLAISDWLQKAKGPQRLRALHTGPTPAHLHRIHATALVVHPVGGFGADSCGPLFRGFTRPMLPGEKVTLTGMQVQVLSTTPDGRSDAAAFRFNVPLEDPSLVWVSLLDGAYQVVRTPPIGARQVHVPVAAQFIAMGAGLSVDGTAKAP